MSELKPEASLQLGPFALVFRIMALGELVAQRRELRVGRHHTRVARV